MEKIKNKKFYFIATAAGPSKLYEEDLKRVIEPIQGWLNCFEEMNFVKSLCFYDTSSINIKNTELYKEAFDEGKAI